MEEPDPQTESPAVKEPRKTARSRVREKTGKEKSLLLMELHEIKEISDIIFEKIEKQIEVLKNIEASVDKKIAILQKLKEGEDKVEKQPEEAARLSEIRSLRSKGLGIREIADILKIPAGEVELIINLNKDSNETANVSDLQQREYKKPPERHLRQRTGVRFPSQKIIWGLSLIILVSAAAVYLFLHQWDRVLIPPALKTDNVAPQQQNLTTMPSPPPSPPADEEKPQDIDSIRKKYSLTTEPQSSEQVSTVQGKRAVQPGNQPPQSPEQADIGPMVTIITTAATIRGKPDITSDPVAWVSKGTVLRVREDFIDDSGKKWSRVVTSDGREGWIADSVVKPSL